MNLEQSARPAGPHQTVVKWINFRQRGVTQTIDFVGLPEDCGRYKVYVQQHKETTRLQLSFSLSRSNRACASIGVVYTGRLPFVLPSDELVLPCG